MDFTRDPIVEVVITSKEGHKLAVRNSRGKEGGEYLVDMVEVVALGRVHFFRNREHTRPFLLPVAQYEICEVKEALPSLKMPPIEKSIKIGERSKFSTKEKGNAKTGGETAASSPMHKEEKAREQRGMRKGVEKHIAPSPLKRSPSASLQQEGKKTSYRSRRPLLPPPDKLVSPTLSRHKEGEEAQGRARPKGVGRALSEKESDVFFFEGQKERGLPPQKGE